jgi:hypothetical protein
MDADQRAKFLDAVREFVADLSRGTFRKGLRVKLSKVHRASGR